MARRSSFDFVLSDWMMPGLNGLELCRAFRGLPRESYGYFILLTAKNEKAEVAQGLEVGADDFLAKPISAAELHARMQAGERIIRMQRELSEKNALVSETLDRISALYSALDRDLVEARNLQMTLVRERRRDFGTAEVSVALRPSGRVGGDLVGYFRLSERQAVLYAIDVSGHGVASAMLAARLAGMLGASQPGGNIVLTPGHGDVALPADVVAARLNRAILETFQIDQYLTCVYAVTDLETGGVTLVQAGHPHPLILRRNGSIERIGGGGLPIGLVADAQYEQINVKLEPGDRLLLMSDGLTEAIDADGNELGEAGIEAMIARNLGLSGTAFLEALVWDVQKLTADGEARDDISAVLYQFKGQRA